MTDFTIHTPQSAPEASKGILSAAESEYGFIPNLLGVLAESPPALQAYWKLGEELNRSSLSPLEQQVVMLAVSRVNRCPYCMAAHSLAARVAGMAEEDLEALRSGTRLSDPKLEALRNFACGVTLERGLVSRERTAEFLAAGYTRAHVLDVVLCIAYKTMSNYTNHIVGTLLDEQLRQMEWSLPEQEGK